jgi:hypothetical protein
MKHIHRASWREPAPKLEAAKDLLRRRAANYEAAVTVDDMDNDALHQLGAAAAMMTTSNCGWATYSTARILLQEIRNERDRRVRVSLIAAGFDPA